jgi:hypothetical protein
MGRRFCDAADIIKNAAKELKRLPRNGFQVCFQQLHSRWRKCVLAQMDYLEGNLA